MEIISMSFLTLIVFAFALIMLLAGVFAAFFGSGRSRMCGGIMAVVGLAVGLIWAYLVGFSDISPFCEVEAWTVVCNAIIDILGVLIGALIAAGIFLVVVLKA